MLPELALFALLLATSLAFCQGGLPWLPTRLGAMALARPLGWLSAALVGLSLLLLAHAFMTDDFTLNYVAQHSNSRLPLPFKFAAVWGGHEGSLLFFLFALTLWNLRLGALALPLATRARAQSVLGWLILLLGLFLLTESNPFARAFPPPFEGRDLNPMLQDVALILHPPLLYLGYVGFAASFALSITALWERHLDASLVHAWRPLARAAWGWLTAGIALGAWWAYHELGWGGWWFWDPVENASLLPWLFGSALLHALTAFAHRGQCGHAILLLGLLTFVMSLLGTFMVRAGVISSVHAFAIDAGRGQRLLLLLGATALTGLILYGWRGRLPKAPERLHWRDGFIGAIALPLLGATVVLIGTFYPLLHPLLGGGAISVGAPYFNTLFVPLLLLAMLTLILLPQTRSRWAGLLVALPVTLWLGNGVTAPPLPALATLLALWLACATLQRVWRCGVRRGHLAHLALAILVLGASQLAGHTHERTLLLAPGEGATVGPYRLQLEAITPELGPNYSAERYHLVARQGERVIGHLYPERRHYSVRTMPMNEVGILRLASGDLYAVPGEKKKGRVALRLAYKPGVSGLWLGSALLALVGLLPLGWRLHRTATKEAQCHD